MGCEDCDLEVFKWRKGKEADVTSIVGAAVWVPTLRNDRESWDPMGNVVGRSNPYSLIGTWLV